MSDAFSDELFEDIFKPIDRTILDNPCAQCKKECKQQQEIKKKLDYANMKYAATTSILVISVVLLFHVGWFLGRRNVLNGYAAKEQARSEYKRGYKEGRASAKSEYTFDYDDGYESGAEDARSEAEEAFDDYLEDVRDNQKYGYYDDVEDAIEQGAEDILDQYGY